MLKSPPHMARIIMIVLKPVKKEARNSKISKKLNPKIPLKAQALPKTLLRSMANEIRIPALSARAKPKKVPGAWL